MGTTARGSPCGRHLVLAQVGDSRAYLIAAAPLPTDQGQTLLGRLLELGKITKEDAARFEQYHVILRRWRAQPGGYGALGGRNCARTTASALFRRLFDALTDEHILSIVLSTPDQIRSSSARLSTQAA
jgi:hypothetical protein